MTDTETQDVAVIHAATGYPVTLCGIDLRDDSLGPILTTFEHDQVTCPDCLAWRRDRNEAVASLEILGLDGAA